MAPPWIGGSVIQRLENERRNSHLGAIDEFSQGDVTTVTVRMKSFPFALGAIPETQADHGSNVGGKSLPKLDGDRGGEVGYIEVSHVQVTTS